MHDIDTIMGLAPVIPVLVIDDVARARPIAKALIAGGLPVLEVALRTPVALEVVREMTKVEGTVIGAGTVLNVRDLDASLQAGAQFIVSPGLTASLGKQAIASKIAFLPGIATAGDVMRGLDLGLTRFKFFPAIPAGGIPALKALAAPFPQCRFCPTGGIGQENAAEWLALDCVACVGGSWLVPPGGQDAAAIEATARKAAGLKRDHRPPSSPKT
jgi:2-dehydro-3-deoxyphosphogluconate aldolase/(4S)-4-hydroxy-2-oxoglutarate aldolase